MLPHLSVRWSHESEAKRHAVTVVVDYFPTAACPRVFYSSHETATLSLFKKTEQKENTPFIVTFNAQVSSC